MLAASTKIESRRLVFQIPDVSLAGEVLDFYSRNRVHLEPWEPSREMNFYTQEYQELLLEAHLREFFRGRGLRFWLRSKEEGVLVGAVNLNQIIRGPFQSCFMGYKMDAAFTGRGLMTEAVARVIPVAFESYGLHRIEANVIPHNSSSKSVLLKNGFCLEGLSRNYLLINGQWADHERYALLNEPASGEPDHG